jgi:hypothetical protein
MTDLEMCKRMAEIEGLSVRLVESALGSNWMYMCKGHGGYKIYNPLTNDELCFQSMIKYRIELGIYGTWYGCFQGDKPPGSDGCLSYEPSAKRAIFLAIIEIHK